MSRFSEKAGLGDAFKNCKSWRPVKGLLTRHSRQLIKQSASWRLAAGMQKRKGGN